MSFPITPAALQPVWDAHGLGDVRGLAPAKRGMNNLTKVVNDAYVIRFDRLDQDGGSRYKGEQLAYQRLRAAGIPCPQVVALDLTKALIPYHYIILTKIDGAPLIDDWPRFSAAQREAAGRAAGRYLAQMHEITFEHYGRLREAETGGVPRWYDHVERFFGDYAPGLVRSGVLDSSVYERMRACIERLRPLVDSPDARRLVHSDYQFENLLHREGVITGIIDFEWAISGDPSWDFRVDEQWDDDCPGSAAHLYTGYQEVRPLAADHARRVWLYKLLFHLDSADMYAGDAGEEDQLAWAVRELLKALKALEREMG